MALLMCNGIVFNMSKIQISKQITTPVYKGVSNYILYSICQRYRFQSKLQQESINSLSVRYCIQYVKDTDFKANYNHLSNRDFWRIIVFNMSKIQISKQITTNVSSSRLDIKLYSICQRYRFQSKLQLYINDELILENCIQYVKDTNFKANYNSNAERIGLVIIVFNMSKIQISKQITTKQIKILATFKISILI